MGYQFTDILMNIAKRSLEEQTINDGDFFDVDGLLVCGKCGENRQVYSVFDVPNDKEHPQKINVKCAVMCRCEKEQEEKEKRKQMLEKLRRISLMDERFFNATFDAFKETPENGRNLKLCKRYSEGFPQMVKNNQGLLMWGNVGTGKSFAAACIANRLMEQGTPIIMTSFVKLLEAFNRDSNYETSFIEQMRFSKLVIFDDLGAERNTDYAIEKVYNVVDARYRSKLPMILTTNLTISEMKEETDIRYSRIYDRIFECCYPMQFIGKSWRKSAAKQKLREMEELLLSDE